MTDEQIGTQLANLRADFHKDFGDFKADMQKQFSGFKDDMHKQFGGLVITLWITQISTIGVILIGVGLLIHFHL